MGTPQEDSANGKGEMSQSAHMLSISSACFQCAHNCHARRRFEADVDDSSWIAAEQVDVSMARLSIL